MNNNNNMNENLSSMETTKTLPSGLLGPIDLLKNSWGIYKKHLWLLVGIMVVPMLVAFVGAFLLAAAAAASITVFKTEASISALSGLLAIGLIALIIFILIQIWGQIALTYALINHHEPQTIVGVYKKALQFVLPYTWITVIVGLVILGGFALFIIPGLILSVLVMFASWTLVAEEKRGLKAPAASLAYFRGRGLAVFGRLLFIIVLSFFVNMVLTLPFDGVDEGLSGIVSFVLTIFLTPFVLTYIYVLYDNVKAVSGEKGESDLKTTALKVFAIIGLVVIVAIPVFAGTLLKTVNVEQLLNKIEAEIQNEINMNEFEGLLPDTMENIDSPILN